MTLRILHVLDHSIPLHSGYAFRTRAILKEQQRLGWETFHLTSPKHQGARTGEEEIDGLHFYRTNVPPAGWRKLPLLDQWSVVHDTAKRLEAVIAATRPDVVHAHSPCLNGIAALSAATPRGIPVVYEVRAFWEDAAVDHGTTREGSVRYRMSRVLETWTLQRAAAVTTICEGLRGDILGRGIPAEQVTVIPNAVDVDEFPEITGRDDELAHRIGLDDAFVLGFLGSFYRYEGLDVLLDAVPQILQFEPRVRIMLVGGGMDEARLKAQSERLGISDRVLFIGRVAHQDVNRYYSLIDLLVFPRKSMRLTETVTPLKPLEAMAQSRLVIASDVGGHRELIEDGRTGYLFAPDDAEALAGAVQRVLTDRRRWDDVKANARRLVDHERNWRVSVSCYAEVYSRAMEKARQS
jgi:PEP-CTERM/exosortase A-associated glycosyltransferase